MAVVTSANVISLSANADKWNNTLRTEEIEIQAGAGGYVVNLRKASVAGAILFQATLAANESQHYSVKLRIPQTGLYLEVVSGTGTVYLYSN